VDERARALSAAVVELLEPLLLDGQGKAKDWLPFRQFEEHAAFWVNVSSQMRLKNKAAALLATHLARARDPAAAAACLETLLDMLIQRGRREGAPARAGVGEGEGEAARSLRPAAQACLVQLYDVVRALALALETGDAGGAGGGEPSVREEMARFVFGKAGRLRQLLEKEEWVFRGVKLTMKEEMAAANAMKLADRTLVREVTLSSRQCPVLDLLHDTCKKHNALYHEGYLHHSGPKCGPPLSSLHPLCRRSPFSRLNRPPPGPLS